MEESKTEQVEKKIFISLDGKAGTEYPKPPCIPEDSYNAVFESASSGEFDNFEKTKKVTKFVFQMRIDDFVHEGKEVTLPFYVRAVVTKAYKPGVSDSTLYSLIDMAGLMDHFHKHYVELETEAAFKAFIEGNLLGRKCRIQVGTANKKNPDVGKRYSKVEKVLRFLDDAPGLPEKPPVAGGPTSAEPVSSDVTPEAGE